MQMIPLHHAFKRYDVGQEKFCFKSKNISYLQLLFFKKDKHLMVTTITITKKDYTKVVLANYYLIKTNLFVNRLIIGALNVLIGLYTLKQNGTGNIAFGGFIFGFGIYYLLKPLIYLLQKKFRNKTYYFTLNENKIEIEEENNKYSIDLSKANLIHFTDYLICKFEDGSLLIFPKKQLTEDVIKSFEKIKYKSK